MEGSIRMAYENRHDTLKLLRECDAGLKMGISSLDDMVSKAADPELETALKQSKQEHIRLRAEAEKQLSMMKDKGKSPNPMAKSMSALKTGMTMQTGTDKDAARLISDGCEKGIGSLNKYLYRYHYAYEKSKRPTRDTISH